MSVPKITGMSSPRPRIAVGLDSSRGPECLKNWIPASDGMMNRRQANSDDSCNQALAAIRPSGAGFSQAASKNKREYFATKYTK